MTCPLPIKEWTSRAHKHSALITPFTEAFIKRRSVGKSHPVHDFLFTYYNCSPQKLKQWVPSFEEELIVSNEVLEEFPWLDGYWFELDDNALSLNKEHLSKNTLALTSFVANLCEKIAGRPPRFGCFGLHEWAMVYKLDQNALRHHKHPLRLASKEVASFVEGQTLCCTHYDAYRFFTEEAKPLNTLKPSLDSRLELEQAGCVHANMDLYKWASKLWPWIGSDLLAKTFMLAIEGRELDMRASPYDLSQEGYIPICIETEEGRKEYQREQQLYTAKAALLREELHAFCQRLIAYSKKNVRNIDLF